MANNILIIEDDHDLAQSLSNYMQQDFTVTVAQNGKQGIKKFTTKNYQLVLLDLRLPDLPGIEVCQALRQHNADTPLLILTGMADAETQIQLLNAGADDYVTKPFDGRQLRARINALLRRSGASTNKRLQTHDLMVDTVKHQVKRGDSIVLLRRKEYDILEYLLQNKGRILTRSMIFDNVWETEGWPNSIDVHIKHLRDKIDRPFDTPLIETAHGVGYSIKDLPVLDS
jgi:DNA-binding response OmpR family regulator